MGRISTCKICGKQILKDEKKYKHNNKTYCKTCHEQYELDKNKYKNLIAYICEIFDLEKPTGIILKQIKDLKDECGYNYSGMQYTIWYYINILNKQPSLKYGISFIKYNYEKASNYWIEQNNIKSSCNEVAEIKTKVIKQSSIDTNRNNKNTLLIDLANLKGE